MNYGQCVDCVLVQSKLQRMTFMDKVEGIKNILASPKKINLIFLSDSLYNLSVLDYIIILVGFVFSFWYFSALRVAIFLSYYYWYVFFFVFTEEWDIYRAFHCCFQNYQCSFIFRCLASPLHDRRSSDIVISKIA